MTVYVVMVVVTMPVIMVVSMIVRMIIMMVSVIVPMVMVAMIGFCLFAEPFEHLLGLHFGIEGAFAKKGRGIIQLVGNS